MISIIVPTLNEEIYLPKLLDSLTEQTFKKFEVIIVDSSKNNNHNNTINIVKNYKKQLKLKIICSKEGVSYQRNLGAKKAAYNNLIFIDADSIPDKEVLQKVFDELNNNSTGSGGGYTYPLSDRLLYRLYYTIFRIFTRIFYKIDGINGCFIFTKKDIHNEIGGFNEEILLAEDYEYTKRLIQNSRFKLMKDFKVKTSIRRFEHDGRLVLPLKLMSAGLYRVFVGDIKNDIFKYRFGIFNR